MKIKTIMLLAMILLPSLAMVSCSEDDGITEEFPNWKVTNENFFNQISEDAKAAIAKDSVNCGWKRIKCWSKVDYTTGVNTDYIIAKVMKSGDSVSDGCPLYTDSVDVHYKGNLIPSTSYNYPSDPYPLGYRFDASYSGTYDEKVSVPSTFTVAGLIDGFTTALQHMHKGDHWVVYIPYQLGYGETAQSSIPAYSTLIFEIRLEDFWH